MLKEAIVSAFGSDARIESSQHPAPVTMCVIPRVRFLDAAKVMKKSYALLASEWASDETVFGRGYGIYACYRWGSEYLIVKIDVPSDDPSYPTLTKAYLPAYRFERQIYSLMGIRATGLPDERPWIKFEDWPVDAWPLRKAFDPVKQMQRIDGEYHWIRAEGEGVYEIPVGPVHAGIIEPGHFRFQAVGENIINLEERLGYVHKGIEKRFESMQWHEASRLAGRVSGDTTVAHSIAYCLAYESMAGCSVPDRAGWIRAILLERERIANHIGDIGMICNDAAFAFMLYQMSRLREIVVRTNQRLFGHRFMMDKVVPGGVSVDIDEAGKAEMIDELDTISREFERLVKILDENPSLEDRLRDTGILAPAKARELCVVGIVARASGMNLDCRVFNPFHPYDRHDFMELDVPVLISGDVHARTWVRIEEVRESIRIIKKMLEHLPSGPVKTDVAIPDADSSGFAAVEGWRGEIIYWLQAGLSGQINRCMVRDPSSVNWLGLELAILGNIVPDFPLCNKSFNQSYSGHDL